MENFLVGEETKTSKCPNLSFMLRINMCKGERMTIADDQTREGEAGKALLVR
jgi:hypothetical protein